MSWPSIERHPDYLSEAQLAASQMIKNPNERSLLLEYSIMVTDYRKKHGEPMSEAEFLTEFDESTADLPEVIPVLAKIKRLMGGVLNSGNDGEMLSETIITFPPLMYLE